MTDQTLDNTKTSTQETAHLNPPKKPKKRWIRLFVILSSIFGLIITPIIAFVIYAVTIYPELPDAATLKDVTYQVPLRIYTQDGKLISEIGTQKRIPLNYSQIPERMIQALISVEDQDFFNHGGVLQRPWSRRLRMITTGSKIRCPPYHAGGT